MAASLRPSFRGWTRPAVAGRAHYRKSRQSRGTSTGGSPMSRRRCTERSPVSIRAASRRKTARRAAQSTSRRPKSATSRSISGRRSAPRGGLKTLIMIVSTGGDRPSGSSGMMETAQSGTPQGGRQRIVNVEKSGAAPASGAARSPGRSPAGGMSAARGDGMDRHFRPPSFGVANGASVGRKPRVGQGLVRRNATVSAACGRFDTGAQRASSSRCSFISSRTF